MADLNLIITNNHIKYKWYNNFQLKGMGYQIG